MTDLNESIKIQQILSEHRKQIDDLDDEIIALIIKRFNIIKQVAGVKKQHNIPARLKDRVDEVINRNVKNAKQAEINDELIKLIYTELVDKSIELEESLLK